MHHNAFATQPINKIPIKLNAKEGERNSLVRVEGIEPSTSVLSGQRSTTELHSQNLFFYYSDFF